MAQLFKSRSHKTGLPPGSLVYVGERRAEAVKITVFDYDEVRCTERQIATMEECYPLKEERTTTWISVVGVHQVAVVKSIGERFGLHPLVQEDILNTDQRPKVEDYGEYLFIVLKMVLRDPQGDLLSEQISFVLTETCVVSFQEVEGAIFEPTKQRIRAAKGRARKEGTDYLTYGLIDAIVDNYFVTLEELGTDIEELEEALLEAPSPDTLHTINQLKRQLIYLRKSVWPMREVIGGLMRDTTQLIKPATQTYLKDVYDHTIQVIDTIETFRDTVSGMLDIYLSSLSFRMNEVMKVLTIIATIFIPLTFIVGVYGMNFIDMPELKWHWGYPAVMVGMLAMALAMVAYFKHKGWW